MTREQLELIANQLAGVAAIYAPGHIAAIRGLISAGSALTVLLQQIRSEDPAAWDAVAADWDKSVAEFKA
jgi:hypothetical protein